MPAAPASVAVRVRLDALRTEFADLAFALERQGRVDAADVVMLLDRRVRELTDEIAVQDAGAATDCAQPAITADLP